MPKGLATCCHGEEPHTVGWRFINERRAINLDPNCGWARGKADVLYVADAFAVMAKVNAVARRRGLVPWNVSPVTYLSAVRTFRGAQRLECVELALILPRNYERPVPRSVRTDMFIVRPAKKGISSARSDMGVVVPHAAPSGANASSCGRCYKHVGPSGPWPGSPAIEPHGRGCLATQVVGTDEELAPAFGAGSFSSDQ